jgi:hypothetical protein
MMGWGNGKVRVSTSFLSTAFVALAGISVTSAPAAAQPTTPLEKRMEAEPGPALGQKYDGVVPGTTGKNPLPAAPKGGPYLTWTGFQMTTTGSRLFLQTTQQVQFDLKEGAATKSGKSMLAVLLHGCRIHMANNRRKIDTRFFATPIAGVSARQRGHDVEVNIALRERVEAVPHSEAGPDGTQFVVLDFPPGKATPEPSALQEPAGEAASANGAAPSGADATDSPSAKSAGRSKRSAR